MEVRRAGPRDADALARLLVEGLATYRSFAGDGYDAGDPLELALGFAMRMQDPDYWIVIAEDASGPVGEVSFMPAAKHQRPVEDPALAHLSNLFVRPSAWGSGLAGDLLRRAVDEATVRGFCEFRLFTPVAHARARRFYEREGWSSRGEGFLELPLGLEILEYRRPLP